MLVHNIIRPPWLVPKLKIEWAWEHFIGLWGFTWVALKMAWNQRLPMFSLLNIWILSYKVDGPIWPQTTVHETVDL